MIRAHCTFITVIGQNFNIFPVKRSVKDSVGPRGSLVFFITVFLVISITTIGRLKINFAFFECAEHLII